MIVSYLELPGVAESSPRPLLEVEVANLDVARIRCLVDSGATNTLIPTWVAEIAGIDLADGKTRRFGVGGVTTTAHFVTVALEAAQHVWEAEVGFCDPWPFAWGLLGHEAFFRWFTVTFRAADLEFEIEPITS